MSNHSKGVMRAAERIINKYAYSADDFQRNQRESVVSDIIAEETGVDELVEILGNLATEFKKTLLGQIASVDPLTQANEILAKHKGE